MKKWMTGALLLLAVAGAFAQKPSNNEITGANVRWFEMKLKEAKVPGTPKAIADQFSDVQLMLGFRHHLSTGKETAYLSIYISVEKNAVAWQDKMTLQGSTSSKNENAKAYKIETTKEDQGSVLSFLKGGKEMYRLDILDINTPQDLVNFYYNNMILGNSAGVYYFVLKGEYSEIPIQISAKNFQSFFKALANPPKQDPKKVDPKKLEELTKSYDLLAKYPMSGSAE